MKGGAGDIILVFSYLSAQVLMSILCGGRTSSGFSLLTHLAHLDKREPTTHLLTERTLILALTLLVNVEQNNVPDVCEVPILQCVQRIRASKVCQCVSLCAVSVFGGQYICGIFCSLWVLVYICCCFLSHWVSVYLSFCSHFVSWFGLAEDVKLVSGRTSVQYHFSSPFSSKRLWFVDTVP